MRQAGGYGRRTLAFMIVRRVRGPVGLGPTPDARHVEIAALRHYRAASKPLPYSGI